jgi:hypothetical protein
LLFTFIHAELFDLRASALPHIPHRILHPQLRILPVRPLCLRIHRRMFCLPQPLVEHALQPELCKPLFEVGLGCDLEQAVTGAHLGGCWRIAATEDDASGRFGNDFEVVADERADLVS